MSLKIKRVFVEKLECTAFELCVGEVPSRHIEIKRIEPEGYMVAIVNEQIVPRTKESLLQLLEAEAVCPMNAFRLELESGEIFSVSEPFVQDHIRNKTLEWAPK